MLKKKFNTSLLFVWLLTNTFNTQGQINIYVPDANIRERQSYVNNPVNIGQVTSLGVNSSINIWAGSSAFMGASSSVPLNVLLANIHEIAGVNFFKDHNEVALSQSKQKLMTVLLSLLSGPVSARFTVLTNMSTWLAGVYNSAISFDTSGLTFGPFNPASQLYYIHIPAFITPPNIITSSDIVINSLDQYRNLAGASTSKTMLIYTTVPYFPSLGTNASQFNFTTTQPYNTIPTTGVHQLSASLTGVPSANAIHLSSSKQSLTSTAGIALPTNNSHDLIYNFTISQSALKNSFVQAGTYTIPLNYYWNNTISASATPVDVEKTSSFEVQIQDLGELVALNNTVDLKFSTVADYQNGVVKDVAQHLRLSRTIPYDLYVKAISSDFSSGSNTIPLDVLQIGPMNGESGISTITLSTNPQQLIHAADPIIDRLLNIRYSIPSSQVHKLLNKPLGNYSTSIIFSFVAP